MGAEERKRRSAHKHVKSVWGTVSQSALNRSARFFSSEWVVHSSMHPSESARTASMGVLEGFEDGCIAMAEESCK